MSFSKIESNWRKNFHWAFLNSLFNKILYFCVLKRWIWGRSVLLNSQRQLKAIFFVDGLRQGLEFALFRLIHLTIFVLFIYQLYNYFVGTDLDCGQDRTFSLTSIFNFYRSSDENALLGLFHEMINDPKIQPFRYLLFFPLFWGIIKGCWSLRVSKRKGADFPSGIWNDYLRWLFPLHPLDSFLNSKMKNVLWNANLSHFEMYEFFDFLKTLSFRPGYTGLIAHHHLANLASAFSEQDLKDNSRRLSVGIELVTFESSHEEGLSLDERFELKNQALTLLQERASLPNYIIQSSESKKEKLSQLVKISYSAIYAQYLLWTLGLSRNYLEAGFYTLFKLGKLSLQALFLRTLIDALDKARSCPQQAGVNLAGVQAWADDLTESCFQAYVQAFNVIPGQPAYTLTGNLSNYHFPTCQVDLDLSGKGIGSKVISSILRDFSLSTVQLTNLNLSNNGLSNLSEITFELMTAVSVLDLSNNGFTNIFNLSSSLPKMTSLKSLYLNQNSIFGQIEIDNLSLTYLNVSGNPIDGVTKLPPTLITLDIANNLIGSYQSNGTVNLAYALTLTTNLTLLNMTNNYFDRTDFRGSMALGKSFQVLTNLTYLGMGNGGLTVNVFQPLGGGYLAHAEQNGVISMCEGMTALSKLKILDLSYNQFGYTASNGTVALAKAIAKMTSLEYLYLEHNWIGYLDNAGIWNLTNAFPPSLKLINLFDNNIGQGAKGSLVSWAQTISKLTNLTQLNLGQNEIDDQSFIILIRQFPFSLVQLDASSNGISFETMQALMLSSSLTWLNLQRNRFISSSFGNKIEFRTSPSLTYLDISNVELGYQLPSFIGDNLKTLILNNNYFDWSYLDSMVVLAQSLKNLTHLIYLDLSFNEIGQTGSDGIIALSESLSSSLTYLNLAGNELGEIDGVKALAKGIARCQNLKEFLILPQNSNAFDYQDLEILNSGLAQTPFPVFPPFSNYFYSLTLYCRYLPTETTVLDISYYIIRSQASDLEFCLSKLTNLTTLKLGQISIFDELSVLSNFMSSQLSELILPNLSFINQYSNTTLSLFFSELTKMSSLTSLKLGGFGLTNDFLISTLNPLTNLTSLDLSGNNLNNPGFWRLAQVLSQLSKLQTLNLNDNYLGENFSPESPQPNVTSVLGQAFSQMPSLTNLNLSNNFFGKYDNDLVYLTSGLSTNLVSLDLGCYDYYFYNQIGENGFDGVMALSSYIEKTATLRYLNLNLQYIGSKGSNGSTALVDSLLGNNYFRQLIANGNYSLIGLTNVEWGGIEENLNQLASNQMEKACQANKCFNSKISMPRTTTFSLGWLWDKVVDYLTDVVTTSPSYFPNSHSLEMRDWSSNKLEPIKIEPSLEFHPQLQLN